MELEAFEQHLKEKNVDQGIVSKYLKSLRDFNEYLMKENCSFDKVPYGKLTNFTEELIRKKENTVADIINALFSYSYFIKNYDIIEEIIDLIESHNAIENLYKRVGELHGEAIRDEVFKNVIIPPLGTNPEKKPMTTKIVMKRLEEKIGEEKVIEILRPCLHGRDEEPIPKDKELLMQLKDIDAFLTKKHQDIVKQAEKHRDEGTRMFAQYVDDEVVEYIKNTPSMAFGIREGNSIIVTKVPYQTKKFLNAKDDRMKRFYSCYCPWVRGAIKDKTESEITRNFCYCSGGFFKIYWDKIFDQPVTVEPIESPLWGDLVCKFKIELPQEIIEKYIKN
ncbi:MAG: hypothetical protein ACFFDW_11345 [Candidatus Thorarchaeota archaeon]